jgi:signal transduction histidine kinase
MNIIINGSEAMPDGGVLTIKSCHLPDDGFVEIEIADTGTGIPEEHLSKVFDPFFSTKEAGKGVGLGLSIVYGIINEHKGTVEAKSKVGKGTTFIIKLPTVAKEEKEKTER